VCSTRAPPGVEIEGGRKEATVTLQVTSPFLIRRQGSNLPSYLTTGRAGIPQRLKLHPGKTSPFPLSCRVESGDILIPDTYHKCLNYFKGNTLDSDSNRRGTPKIIAIHAKGLAEARNCIEHETTQLSELIQDLQHQNSTDLPFIYLFQVSTTLS